MMNDKFLSTLSKKAEMYNMIISIEEDFILNFKEKLQIDDIPPKVIAEAKKVDDENDEFLAILRGLNIQSYNTCCCNCCYCL